MNNKLMVNGAEISVTTIEDKDYISLTDMLKAKDGDFFISDWLRNRNTVEFLGKWEQIHNPNFNYGDFAFIRSHWTHGACWAIWRYLRIQRHRL